MSRGARTGLRDGPIEQGRGDPPTPEHGGPLLVTPRGTTQVATDRMHAHLEQIAELEQQLASAVRTLRHVGAAAAWSTAPGAPQAAVAAVRRCDAELAAAADAARRAHLVAERLQGALRAAIAGYDAAGARAQGRLDLLASVLGAELGFGLRVTLPGVALLGAVGWLASRMPDPGGRRAHEFRRLLLDHPELVTGPAVVRGVRMFASGLDEAGSAFFGVPVPVAVLLGAAGVTGVRSSARGLLTIGPLLGLFRETPVAVDRVSTFPVAAPALGAAQRLDRVPEVDQVRVERYDAPGKPSRFVVYLGPTETFSPVADHEPWDLTSNVGGVGGMEVGAFRAGEIAMRDAGVTPRSEVQFVGFSQGGLIATMLAASGDWTAAGLQTFGAPAGNIALPDGLTGMAVRNTDDFIPMLAGPQLDHHLLQVERQVFAPGETPPTYHAAPAHQRDAYAATAAVVDAATSRAVREQNDALDAFTADYASQRGSTITVTSYHATRVDVAEHTVDPDGIRLRDAVRENAATSGAR